MRELEHYRAAKEAERKREVAVRKARLAYEKARRLRLESGALLLAALEGAVVSGGLSMQGMQTRFGVVRNKLWL